MKKTDRKNKTGLVVTWPTNLFTIEECNKANPNFVNITLRVRIKNAITAGTVNELGYLHNGKGRPRSVMVAGPITQDHLAAAKNRGVIFKAGLSVNVMNVPTVKADPLEAVTSETISNPITTIPILTTVA